MEHRRVHSQRKCRGAGLNLRSIRGAGIGARVGASLLSLTLAAGPALSQSAGIDITADRQKTETPIKHLIVIIGENRTFDHVFATYVPRSKDSVSNLLSKGIIKADGSPGKNFAKAAQFETVRPFKTKYFVSLDSDDKKPYVILPQPTLNFAPTKPTFPAGTLLNFLAAIEPSLAHDDLSLLTTGAATEFTNTFTLPDPDTHIANFDKLPNGPFQLKGNALPYDS